MRDILMSVMVGLIVYLIAITDHPRPQHLSCAETVRVGISTYCNEYKVGRD